MNSLEVMNKYAYIKDKPIRNKSQSIKEIKVVKQPSKSTLALYDKVPVKYSTLNNVNTLGYISGYGQLDKYGMLNFYRQLGKVLLDFGGRDVIFKDFEEDYENLYKYGQLWYGDKVDKVKMTPNQCHRNSCDLWYSNKDKFDIRIATGYALTSDGYWVQHSWLVEKRSRSMRVIETTVKMLTYYGFVMTGEECHKFSSYY